MLISQYDIHCFISDNISLNFARDHAAAHITTKIEYMLSPLPGTHSWHPKKNHLGGFFLHKTRQRENNCELSDPSSDAIYSCLSDALSSASFASLGSVRSWFHNSYAAVQSLLTVLTLLCVKPSFQCVSEVRSPRHSPTRGCGVHTCLWLFGEKKGLLLDKLYNAKAVSLLLFIRSTKLHVLIACNRFRTLHFAFVSHSSAPDGDLTKKMNV